MGIRVPSITTQAWPAFFALVSAWRSFGARAASRTVVSVTYRQAVAVPTWIQRSRAAAQPVRACWRASRLSCRVVRYSNRAAITGLFGIAAQTARQAASRRPGRPRPEIEVLPWAAPEALSRGHSPACPSSARAVANRARSRPRSPRPR